MLHTPGDNRGQSWGWSPSLGFVNLGFETPTQKNIYDTNK